MNGVSQTELNLRSCVGTLLQEIDRAQRAAVHLDFETVEQCALHHLRLTEDLRQALVANPAAEELIAPLRASLRRYALVLQASKRLVETITRVIDSGRVVSAYEG